MASQSHSANIFQCGTVSGYFYHTYLYGSTSSITRIFLFYLDRFVDKVSTRFFYLLISLICFQYILSSLLYITCTIVHKTCRNGKSKDRCALFTHKRCTVLVSRLCPFCPLYDKSQLYIFCSISGVYFIHLIKVLIVVYKK